VSGQIDLRSDFVARPTAEMIAFAGEAALRPAAFLPWEDPLVQELEAAGAALFGRLRATFAINCSTANYLALSQLLGRFDCLVLDRDSHVVRHEAALLGFVEARGRVVIAKDGLSAAMALLREGRRVLLGLENTQLYACGRALDDADLARLRAAKSEAGDRLGLHLDGSRLFNAAAARGYDLVRDFDFVDSLSLSLNKGLAAPIGALLVAESDVIDACNAQALAEARIVRPAHVPAAYGLVALRRRAELAHDNRRAAALASGLVAAFGATGPQVEYGGTNIVFIGGFEAPAVPQVIARLATRGILVRAFRDAATIRLVFHRDVGDADLARLEREILDACRGDD